jgi:hypothetical protein
VPTRLIAAGEFAQIVDLLLPVVSFTQAAGAVQPLLVAFVDLLAGFNAEPEFEFEIRTISAVRRAPP